MKSQNSPSWWPLVVSAVSLLVAAFGILADATSIITNESARIFIAAVYPYLIVVSTVLFAVIAITYWNRSRRLARSLTIAYSLEAALFRRLPRVVGSGVQVDALLSVPESKIQPLLDELVGALPSSFGSHQKLSVARPNHDGTFTLLATRGMDPVAIASIERRASWITGRSFYASLLNDPQRREWCIFPTSDTTYVDTRPAGDSASRPTSSSSHFLLALRDEDIYNRLPKQTLALVSVGIPKRIGIPSSSEGEELFRSVLPAAKAIEVLLLSESRASSASNATSAAKLVEAKVE